MSSKSPRAKPLPPDERRAALVAATLPLLLEQGNQVTTKQIAEASGVAEGTIFRVFPDKQSLICSAVGAAFDPAPTVDALAEIDHELSLDARLEAAVEILQESMRRAFRLISMLEMRGGPPDEASDLERRQRIREAVVTVIEPDADQLTTTPVELARLVSMLVFAGTFPRLTENRPLTAEDIVSLLLDGRRKRG